MPLFEVNPDIDRAAVRAQFERDRRAQIRDVLTEPAAREIRRILVHNTKWGVAWKAGQEGPHVVRGERPGSPIGRGVSDVSRQVGAAMARADHGFVYSHYPLLDAYLRRWDPGGPHDMILEHLNDRPFLDLIREVSGIPELKKADGQATLYEPGQFLTIHDDEEPAQSRRVAYVLNMTVGEWRPDWGGFLMFYDEEGDVVAGFKPRFNSLNLFAVPQRHSVSYVPPFSPVARFAITGWFLDK